MTRLGFGLDIPRGLLRQADGAITPELLGWSWYADAVGPSLTNVVLSATTNVSCWVDWRFLELPKYTLLVATSVQTPGQPPPTRYETTDTAVTGGHTADQIEYRMHDASGILIDWTVLTGQTFYFPLFGDPPTQS